MVIVVLMLIFDILIFEIEPIIIDFDILIMDEKLDLV
jgi:hypothetical protein